MTSERRQKRMKRMVEDMQHYWNTYSDHRYYLEYSDDTFINDALYAIGINLDRKYKGREGFLAFRKFLVNYLGETLPRG